MSSTWRQLFSKAAFGCAAISSLTASVGCQTWSPSTWGVPSGSRVQPPPTGTVKPQGVYYNNPPMGSASASTNSTTQIAPNPSAPVVQASASDPFGSNGSMPATNLNATSIGSQTNSDSNGFTGQVSTAGYTDNGSGMAQVVTAASLQGSTQDTVQGSANYTSDSAASPNAGDGANLQWTSK